MAAADMDLAGVVAASGVTLREVQGRLVGHCPRCAGRLVVDRASEVWTCRACGSGGPAEWVALTQGVSVSHAAELLRAGWRPGEEEAHAGERTTRLLAPLCPADADDPTLLDAVVTHYVTALAGSEAARAWLAQLGVDEELAFRLRVGVSNRTLGYRLPQANRKDGAALRSRLVELGIYRPSGHEHFTGCIVIPVLDAGRVVGLCGYRLDRPDPPRWAGGLPGGLFPATPTTSELFVVASIRDALAVLAAGHEAVVAPGRPSGFSRRDIATLAKSGVTRAVVVDAHPGLTERLERVGIGVRMVMPGAGLTDLLPAARDPARALKSLLGQDASATPAASAPAPPSLEDVRPTDASQESSDRADLTQRGEGGAVDGDACELFVTFPGRRWRVRGADRNRVPDALRVALSVADVSSGAFHLDTVDLYAAKARTAFLDAAAAELSADPAVLRRELTDVLFATERALAAVDDTEPAPVMSEEDRDAGLELLRDPTLTDRVIDDLGSLGVVGERTNLLVAYLATISRKAERPFGVVIQSSSAAGKSTLADAVCALVPEEDLASYSALTGQALYYVSGQSLAHKVLAVAEEQGASRAAYALKLLVTEGRLSIASTGKDPATGRLRTTAYTVTGPVALVLTTTATDIDPELANRVVVLGVDEDPAQTRAIHAAQRHAATLDGLLARLNRDQTIRLHRNAQRLLDPLPVVIPNLDAIEFPAHAVRHRRDHQKLLALITASALLHQHQRTRRSVEVAGRTVSYLEADQADVELAVRLAETVLAHTGDELAPQTRRILTAAQQLTAERAPAADDRPVVFTRRELRERLGTTEHQVRVGLARLVALEYLSVVLGLPGWPHRYTLTDPPACADVGEPGDTLRYPCEADPPGPPGLSPAQMPDPATPRPVSAQIEPDVDNVDVPTPQPDHRRSG